MCTIIAAVDVWPGSPLVIAANRDEALNRPAIEPRVWAAGEVAARRVLAPRDLKAGGTWLGINDAGLFVGITNRRSLAGAGRPRRSRGELVFEALGAATPTEARARVRELGARDYNPFHLLLADRSGARVVWGDGDRLHEVELAPGIHWITERSLGAGVSARHQTLAELAAELASGPAPDIARWRSILADHRPHQRDGAAPGALSVGLDAMCVHARPINYGTRSSTLVQLGPAEVAGVPLRFMYANGRPCETAFVDQHDAVQRLLDH
ncbi:hypothetical protein DB30_01511 [Enhygromyxa salina]|uniref:NRDE family protein n=1 Tax=Enhygromyxa salina TaxID=215803 RepID=A0A0C1Z3W9_9BACT|nr:NRDE family protein [Enhygromyxa salina]KIG12389.1 hypothetical protein DB30_01511 [Enhygromyxa salina]